MNLSQAAALLQMSRDDTRAAVTMGFVPTGGQEAIRLKAEARGSDYEISDEELDAFLIALEEVEPGRHPPVAVQRQLLVNARERCCVCGEGLSLDFHHIIEWSRIKHHDPQHMMVVCKNCHGRCTAGEIDVQRQREYQRHPFALAGLFSSEPAFASVTWDDLRSVVLLLHTEMKRQTRGDSGHDLYYSDIERKNALNRLSDDVYNVFRTRYEPKCPEIKRFLSDDHNADLLEKYYQVVDDLRMEIAFLQGENPLIPFDKVLRHVFDSAFRALAVGPAVNREALKTLVAFMYFECDIGRK